MIYQFVLVTTFGLTMASGLAQKYDYNWVAGSSFTDTLSMINFSDTGVAYLPYLPPILQGFGSFGISNEEGALQFYTNGNYIVSWNHEIMENGDSLNAGAWGAQNGTFSEVKNEYKPYTYFVLPDPDNDSFYYLIHSYVEKGVPFPLRQVSTRLQITKIDMHQNNGLGRVVYKNKTLYTAKLCAIFSAIRHGNGSDWWILIRELDGLRYHNLHMHGDSLMKVTLQDTPEWNALLFDHIDSNYTAIVPSFPSNNGALVLDVYGKEIRRIYNFDRCSGEMNYIDHIYHKVDTFIKKTGSIITGPIECLTFSPDDQFVYGVSVGGYFQWDLKATDITASEFQLSGFPYAFDNPVNPALSNVIAMLMQLGPDGRIYAMYSLTHNIIRNPNGKGTESDFCHAPDDTVSCLGVPYSFFTPRYPNYRLGPLVGSGCDTISAVTDAEGVSFELKIYPNPATGPVRVEITLPDYGSKDTELVIHDVLGREVHRHRFPPYAYLHTWDITAIAKGAYILQLLSDQRPVATERLLVH